MALSFVILIVWSQPLFAFSLTVGKIAVSSDRPIPAAGGMRVLRDCERLLERSPLTAASTRYHLYVANDRHAGRHPTIDDSGLAYRHVVEHVEARKHFSSLVQRASHRRIVGNATEHADSPSDGKGPRIELLSFEHAVGGAVPLERPCFDAIQCEKPWPQANDGAESLRLRQYLLGIQHQATDRGIGPVFVAILGFRRRDPACKMLTNMPTSPEMRDTRKISWIKAARRDFEQFPKGVQGDMLDALTVAAEGGKSDKAKPFKGSDGGVFEITLRYRSDAFRAIYAVKIDADVWVIHAFQKKSKSGIKTPRMEVELIHDRLKRLKEALR
jgi:phage-related protein